MIIALEGPDRAGKTTLFESLRGTVPHAVFVPNTPTERCLLPVMSEVLARADNLWRALYDPSKLYICDRHLAVSSQVYDRLYNRRLLDVSFWVPEVRVLYLRPSEIELRRRHAETEDEAFDAALYARVIELYDEVVAQFRFTGDLDVMMEWVS